VKSALSDTGSGAIFAPQADVDAIAKELKAVKVGTNYALPCDGNPDFVVTIGGKPFHVKTEHYVINTGPKIVGGVNYCLLAIVANQRINHWILGTPFMSQFCQIYDVGQKRIGFAEAIAQP
uniref:Peptidase A1 domain-containing protein n=1 Tax=Steinernema glaseri TaxID=37863 RepID=A0A1I7Y029_9BILA